MQSAQLIAFVTYVGLLVQLVGALLLVGLFALLRRFVLRRGYFRAWTFAWEAMAVALVAVALRIHLTRSEIIERVPWVEPALHGVYMFAKLLTLAFLLAGTVMYVTGRRMWGDMRWAALGIAAYAAAVTPLMDRGYEISVLVQAPLLIPTLTIGAILLLRLPPSRRSLGNRVVAGGFLLMATLWCVYPFAYASRRIGDPNVLLVSIANYGSYLDLVCQIILGYAMVVVLMEDAKREVDDAQAELRVAHDQLRRDTFYDPLTGALNRRAFGDGVGLDLARASYGTVALLDLDNLKEVNDAHGHAGGDALIRHLVDVLRHGLRASDKVYRWGGDEFLLIVPQARASEVQLRLANLVQSASPLVMSNRAVVRLEVSVGAVDFASGEELDNAIALADAGMYREKHRRKKERLTPMAQRVVR
jgi:diguanylate cyclase